jgi:multidrug transporter EmrE-like cation transporter
MNLHQALHEIKEGDGVHGVILLALQLPALALDELRHHALHETRVLLGLDSQGHVMADQGVEPVLIGLQLLSNVVALLSQLKNSLNSLHFVIEQRFNFLSVSVLEMSALDITLMSLTEIIGDFGFKNVARTGSLTGWATGLGGYAGVIFYLVRSLRIGNVTYVNGMWDGVSAILETAAAFFLFGERLNSWKQYVGLGLIIMGLFALKSGGIAR